MSTPEKPINPYAAPQTALEDGDDPLEYFPSREALGRVATGLNLVYWGIALFLGCFIGMFSLAFMFRFGPAALIGILITLFGLGFIVSIILGLVGRIFCLAVPAASGARHIIYTAVAFDVITIFLAIGQRVIALPVVSSGGTSFLSLLATILFVIFLQRVATYIHQPDLADQAKSLIIMGLFLMLLIFVMGASAFVLGPLAALIGIAILVLVILMVLRYIRLLVNLRKEILNRE